VESQAEKSHPIRVPFHPPRLTENLIARPALWARLEAGLHNPLTIVIAPSGYGKTTTVAGWLAHSSIAHADLPTVWWNITKLDDNFPQFCRQLVAAVQSVIPDACEATNQMLVGRIAPDEAHIAAQFVRDIALLPSRLLLVLDDYHEIFDPAIHRVLETIVRQQPASLALMLLARHDPPLSIARLRSQQALVELRLADLQFSYAEAEEFLAKFLLAPLPPTLADRLYHHHQGWGAGVQLLALSLVNVPDIPQFLDDLDLRQHPYITDYFMDEVLARQPASVQAFLMRSSLLPMLHPALCAAALGEETAGQTHLLLDHVVQHNLFVVPLDEQQGAYRYHDLFQTMLRTRLLHSTPASEVTTIYCRMAAWFAETGDLERAIDSYLSGNAPQQAALLVEANIHDLQEREEWQRLDHLLHRLPTAETAKNPALLLALGWLYQFRYQAGRLQATIASIHALLADPIFPLSNAQRGEQQIELEILTLFPLIRSEPLPGLSARIRQVNDQAGAMRPFLLSKSLQLLARTYQREGDIDGALLMLDQALAAVDDKPLRFHLHLLHIRCEVLNYEGRFAAMMQTALTYLQLAEQTQLLTPLSAAHFVMAEALYFTGGQDDAVIKHCRHVLQLSHVSYLSNLIGAMSIMTQVLVQQNETEAAQQVSAEFRALALRLESVQMLAFADMLDAHIAITEGRAAAALPWLKTFAPQSVSPNYALSALIWGKGMLALGDQAALREGSASLRMILERSRAINARLWVVELLILLARFSMAQQTVANALEALQEALLLGYAHGHHRSFLEADPAIDELLMQLSHRQPICEVATRLLQKRKKLTATQPARQAPPTAASPTAPPTAPLTAREQEVLTMLAANLSIKEIARDTHLSVHTVDNHVRKIYAKLGVHSRLDAVLRAQTLGLLS